VFEESVEGFIARWRPHAVDGRAFARAEGSPLLEVDVAGTVLQLFERTGPYDAPAGPVCLIVHAVVDDVRVVDAPPHLTALAPARFALAGRVLERDGVFAVVDVAGTRLVLASEAEGSWPPPGTALACETLAPAQAFVLRRARRAFVVATDEQV
jgi:hypothetical protein